MIRKQMTFENFVVGSCNRFAYVASEATANNPGVSYNPLVLYSFENGVGKTHLLNAIANRLEQRGLTVALLTADELTEMLVDSLVHHGSVMPISESLLEADAFILDSFERTVGRESLRSVLYKVIDHLIEHGRQVVVSSDVPLDDLPATGLSSLVGQGLQADLQPVDQNTARSILLAKAEDIGLQLTEEQISEIIRTPGDARKLLGALTAIQFRKELDGQIAIDELLL